MVDMDMDTMVTMVRDLLMLRPSQLLLLSQVMDTMAMDMDTLDMAMDMDMVMDTMDTMARDLLRLSQDMDTMVMAMVMDMVMVMDTMDKYLSFLFCRLEFSTNEIGPLFGTSHFQTI